MPDATTSVPNQRVLIVDDLDDARETMRDVLRHALGIEVDTAADGQQALQLLEDRPYSAVITDLRMPKLTGQQLMSEIRSRQLPVTVIVTTGHGSIDSAVQAMRQGAFDFLAKPVDPQHLTLLVRRALADRLLQDEVLELRRQLGDRYAVRSVLSKSPKMLAVFGLIHQVAETNSTVLIVGETGTGKEMIARAVHEATPSRRVAPMVAVNCAALSEHLLESELFGHEKGSFTGAVAKRIGRFEQASGGTLFLDEIGDVPMSMQVKLLRVLQDRRIERVGGGEPIDIDVRLVAATNRPLEMLVSEGKFREDLFYRLNVIRVELPPLRDRPEDIPLLASHFLQKYARPRQAPPKIAPDAMEHLIAYSWPGNVRQLENAIEQACVTVRDGTIGPEQLPADVARRTVAAAALNVDVSRPLSEQLGEITAALEEKYLRAMMKKTRGHVGKCAEFSGLSRRSITDKLAQYRIDKKEFKDGTDDEE